MITGQTLIEWGFVPGKWFKNALADANTALANGMSTDDVFVLVQGHVPVETLMRTNGIEYATFLDTETDAERENAESVALHMDALMRVPTIVKGAVMPDACPAGSQPGTIPVGGAVAAKDAIHPGFHSADICCSVAISLFGRNDDPKKLLDAIEKVTHFGPGGRSKSFNLPKDVRTLVGGMENNRFLDGLEDYAISHFATQGDGNHFAFVGTLNSTGQLALVTHHGSRGLGAQVYKRGMAVAKRHTAIHAPRIPPHNAWIDAESEDGRSYWDALQQLRIWTRESHFHLHDLAARTIGNKVVDRFWNEHNFVFRKSDGLYYHGKGATPSWSGFAADDSGTTLIPLNMAQPVLLTRHTDKAEALGFAPHGAGRNMGRKAFLRENAPSMPVGIDARSFCGKPDLSELPEAYKDADSVRRQIEKYGLAEVYDWVNPYGNIMAGDWESDAPWKKGKR